MWGGDNWADLSAFPNYRVIYPPPPHLTLHGTSRSHDIEIILTFGQIKFSVRALSLSSLSNRKGML